MSTTLYVLIFFFFNSFKLTIKLVIPASKAGGIEYRKNPQLLVENEITKKNKGMPTNINQTFLSTFYHSSN